MIEWVYPVSALAVLYLAVIPALTWAAWVWLSSRSFPEIHAWGTPAVWLALVLPVGLPLAVFVLDALHQFDAHHALEVCVTPHASGGCAESVVLGLLVLLPLFWRASRVHNPRPRGKRLDLSQAGLSHLRVWLDEHSDAPVATRGLWRPWVAVRPDALASLSARQFEMAMWHEHGHVVELDPLRRWLAHALVAVNPLGHLLRPYVARWELGREAHCDLLAAQAGDRFAMAEALVQVARLPSHSGRCCALLSEQGQSLALRVQILVHDVLPALPRRSWRWLPALAVVGLVAQALGHEGLHWLHMASEQFFLALVG